MNKEKTFITSSGKFIYQENGILRCYPEKKLRMEAKHNIENYRAVTAFMQGRRCPFLTDLRGSVRPSKESIKITKQLDLTKVHTAVGIIVGSGISKVLGNFLLTLNRFPVPTKLFTNVEATEKWLLQYIEEIPNTDKNQ